MDNIISNSHAKKTLFILVCKQLIDFQRVVRTGWMNHEVKQPESVADHMYRMSMMALMLDSEESKVDKNRCDFLATYYCKLNWDPVRSKCYKQFHRNASNKRPGAY